MCNCECCSGCEDDDWCSCGCGCCGNEESARSCRHRATRRERLGCFVQPALVATARYGSGLGRVLFSPEVIERAVSGAWGPPADRRHLRSR